MTVYVVTNPENGWDCVCGVFGSAIALKEFFAERIESMYELSEEELELMSLDNLEEIIQNFSYIIHDQTLYT